MSCRHQERSEMREGGGEQQSHASADTRSFRTMRHAIYDQMDPINGLPVVTVEDNGLVLRVAGLRGSQVALLPAILHRALATGDLVRTMSVRVDYAIGSRPHESTIRATAGRLNALRDMIGFCGMVAAEEDALAVARAIELMLLGDGERCFFLAFQDERSLQAWLLDHNASPDRLQARSA